MNEHRRTYRLIAFASIGLWFMALHSERASATLIAVTYGNPGAQTADSTALCLGTSVCVLGTESFNSVSTANLTTGFTSTFGLTGSQTITGTYSADATAKTGSNLVSQAANQYGGAGGTGSYPELMNGSYTIALAVNGVPGVNYFGLWISALDANNTIAFYGGGSLLFTFTPSQMITAINATSNKAAYYGNPNNPTQDTSEPFAFVNFFGVGGTFDKLVISNCCGTGFETDNQTVGYRNPAPIIGNLFGVPEPSAPAILAIGIGAMLLGRRRVISCQKMLSQS